MVEDNMKKQEFKEYLDKKLCQDGFLKKDKNTWILRKNGIVFEIEWQNSVYGKEHFYVNLSFAVEEFMENENDCHYVTQLQPETWLKNVENEYIKIIKDIDKFISNNDCLDKIKYKFTHNRDYNEQLEGRKLIAYLDPTDKRYEPKQKPDYTKDENLFVLNKTYLLCGKSLQVPDYFYETNEERWKDFSKRNGYRLKVINTKPQSH